MERGAWQATVHGIARVGRDLATQLITTEICQTLTFLFYVSCFLHCKL